ncbi:MAG: LamG-like jellyroll fold domain-containing protein, partial [Lentisphaeria bacterium]
AVDSDGDGLSDWLEVKLGTDPYDPDTDGDSLLDGWEVRHGFNPLDSEDVIFEPLAGWWKLDETAGVTAYDNSIYTNNGAVSGADYADAGWNFVYSFDGTNSAVLITNSCHYKPPYVSVAAVVNFAACPDAVTNGGVIDGRMPLLAQNNPSGGFTYALYKTTTNALVFEIATLSATNVLQTVDDFVTTGVWYHVAGAYDGANASLYVNGEMAATTPFSGALEYNAGSGLTLGKAEWVCGSTSNQSYLSGLLSDVRVYSSGLASYEVYDLWSAWSVYYTNMSNPNITFLMTNSSLRFIPVNTSRDFMVTIHPTNVPLNLTLERISGATGRATFADGSTSKYIFGTTTNLVICGAEASDSVDNLRLRAVTDSGREYQNQLFTVVKLFVQVHGEMGPTNTYEMYAGMSIPVLPLGKGEWLTLTTITEPEVEQDTVTWWSDGEPAAGLGSTFWVHWPDGGCAVGNSYGAGASNIPSANVSSVSATPNSVTEWQNVEITVTTDPSGHEAAVTVSVAPSVTLEQTGAGTYQAIRPHTGDYTVAASMGMSVANTSFHVDPRPESEPEDSTNDNSYAFVISLYDSGCVGNTLVASGYAVQQDNVTWQITGPNPGGIKLIPFGCQARVEGTGTVKVRGAVGTNHHQTVTVTVGQPCASGKCGWSSASFTLDSLNMAIGLGRAFDGSTVGTLTLMSSNMNSSLSKPSTLSCVAKPEVEQIWTNSMMRQVRATEGLLDIVTNNDYAYEIRFYAAAAVGAKANGLYGVQGDPIKVLEVRNPDEAADSNRLWITETVIGHTNRTEFIYDEDFQAWGLSKGDGLNVETLLKEDLGNGYRLETRQIMDANEVVAAQSETMFYTFAWGEGVVGRWVECGNAQLVTSNDYYNNASEPGRYGQLYQEVHSDGSWMVYDYDTNGRVVSVVSPWKSVPAGTSPDQAKAEYRSYASVDQNDTIAVRPWEPRMVRETVVDVEVGRTYFAWYVNGNGETVQIEERCGAPGADYGATGNLRTTTVYYPTNTTDGSAGQVKNVTYPDGRYELSEFERGTWQADQENPTNGNFYVGEGSDAIRRLTLHASTANPNGVVNRSLIDVEVLVNGRSVLNETCLMTAQENVPIASAVRVLDALGHVTAEVKSDGRRMDATWACCGKDYEKDEQGLERYYLYDALNRLESTEQAGVTAGEYPAQAAIYWTYAYDAAGRMLREERQAGGLSQITSNTYDLAGRLLGKTDSAGLATTCVYSESPKQVQETLPGGATRVTEQYADGRRASVTGTAQTPVYYDYGVNEDGTQWTLEYHGSSDSPYRAKTTTDLLGRTVRVEKPGFNGTETNEFFYNAKGQLIRQSTTGGPQSLFAYDEFGSQIQSGLDINANGEL